MFILSQFTYNAFRFVEFNHRDNQVYALTTQPATGGERESRANQVYALTTHQLQVERRES